MPRKPLGVHSRAAWDWFFENIASAQGTSPAVGGNFSYIAVFNNATDGSYLYPIDFDFHTSATTADVFLEHAYSNFGGSSLPVVGSRPGIGAVFGLCTTFSSAVDVGSTINDLYYTGANLQWGRARFIAKIPPGYSFLVRPGTINIALAGALSWMMMKE